MTGLPAASANRVLRSSKMKGCFHWDNLIVPIMVLFQVVIRHHTGGISHYSHHSANNSVISAKGNLAPRDGRRCTVSDRVIVANGSETTKVCGDLARRLNIPTTGGLVILHDAEYCEWNLCMHISVILLVSQQNILCTSYFTE